MNINKVRHFILRHPHIRSLYLGVREISNAIIRRNPLQSWSRRVKTLDYLNVGCSKKIYPHTINLDHSWFPGIDLTADIRRRLPIADGRLRGIFCEHVIEHLPFNSVPLFLSECRRTLCSGGVVRIIIPDAELYMQTYCSIRNGKDICFPYHDPEQTPMMQINAVFRSYGHQYAYDFETLERLLREAGFIGISRVNFHTGQDHALLLDSEDRRIESLYVEAVKSE